MLRAAVALLLAVAALAAVDLRGLVDAVFSTTSSLERFAPTYVFEVDGCRVLVYVVNSTLKNSPLEAWINEAVYFAYDPIYHPRSKALRPLTSAEVERLLEALFQVLGPSVEVGVGVWTIFSLCDGDLHVEAKDAAQAAKETREDVEVESARAEVVPGVAYAPLCESIRYEYLHLEVRDATQLVEKVQRAVEVELYLGAADARATLLKRYEASEGAAVTAAYLYLVTWKRSDPIAVFIQETSSARLIVKTANLSAVIEALRKAREAAGEAWKSVEVILWYGPYFISGYEAEALRKAARMLEKEHWEGWEFIDEKGQVRRIWGHISLFIDELGPPYVVFPYPSGVVPDKATAERLVRRFVELSGFCKSPLVVEFWPEPELKPPSVEQPQPLWVDAAAIATVAAITIGIIVYTIRRR